MTLTEPLNMFKIETKLSNVILDSVFAPKDIDLENGEMDDDEREIEAFKRFCFNSVPLKEKPKVNFDMKSISLKKK